MQLMSSAKKTIGIVSWDFSHAKGGMGRSMEWIAESLSADFEVVVGTPGYGLPVTGYRGAGTSLLSFTKRFGGHTLFSLLLPFVLGRWIRKHRIDFLMMPGGPGGVFLWKKPNIPYICSVYHIYEQQARLVPGQGWKKVFIPLEKKTYRNASLILSFNTDTRRVLEETYRLPADRIVSLPHPVSDTWKEASTISRKKGLCVCVARLEERKGVGLLLQAWSLVTEKRPDAQLMIIGQGILADRLDERIRHLHHVVRIPGLLFSDLLSVVKQAEVAVCPAYLEGFGLAAAEAMMAGTAVVAAESEGLRCLVGYGLSVMGYGERGFLFESGNAEECAAAILAALNDDDRRGRVISEARQYAELHFDHQRATDALQRVINERVTNGL